MLARQRMILRRLVGAVLACCLLSTAPARADRPFSDDCRKEDSSTPPDGTKCSGGAPEPVAFPGKLQWTEPGDPPPQPEERSFSTTPGTPANFFCSSQICSGVVEFYYGDSDTKTCGASCDFTTRHWAKFGTVSGRVTLKNGAPVANFSVLAQDPTATPLLSWSKAVRTDATGF
jgi:hypothetical protein